MSSYFLLQTLGYSVTRLHEKTEPHVVLGESMVSITYIVYLVCIYFTF